MSAYQNWSVSVISQSDSVNVERSSLTVQEGPDSISLNLAAIPEGIAYFSAPKEFLGNKLTSYGNHLAYTVLYDGNGKELDVCIWTSVLAQDSSITGIMIFFRRPRFWS